MRRARDEDGSLIASPPGEIVPSNRHGFYTYEAKYLDEDGAAVKVPPTYPRRQRQGSQARDRSLPRARLRGPGAHRFLPARGRQVHLNEVNTLPGFTNISMYPKVMEAIGVRYPELVDRLIRHALARAGVEPRSKAEARKLRA